MKKCSRIILIAVLVVFAVAIVGCSVTFIPQDNDVPDMPSNDISQSNNVNVDFSKLTYCAYGDSITWGYDSGRRMDNPYPTLVAQSLGLKSYVNAGISGATYVTNIPNRDCVADIVNANKASYDIISVMAGVNDFSVSTPLGKYGDSDTSTVYGSIDFIARTLIARNPNSFVFFMTPYKKGDCTVKNAKGYVLLDVAVAVKEVASKYNIPVLDMYQDGKYEVYGMYDENSDKLHPNQKFVTMYTAPQIVRFIRANYGK